MQSSMKFLKEKAFIRFLFWLIPPALRQDELTFIRASVAVMTPSVFFISGSFVYYDVEALYPLSIAWFVGFLINALIPLMIRPFKSYKVASVIFVIYHYYKIAAVLISPLCGLMSSTLTIYIMVSGRLHYFPFEFATVVPTSELKTMIIMGLGRNILLLMFCATMYSWLGRTVANRIRSQESYQKQLFNSICHELRQPCQSIVNGVRMMADCPSPLAHDEQNILDTVGRSSRYLSCLLNDILDYGKLDLGAMILQPQTSSLATLIEDSIEMSVLGVPPSELDTIPDIIYDYDDVSLPENVHVDPTRFGQLLGALINSALRAPYMDSVLCVYVTCKRCRKPDNTAQVSPPTTPKRAFFASTDPEFVEVQVELSQFRGQGVLWRPEDGMVPVTKKYAKGGVNRLLLALTVCKRIVALMGGSLRLIENDQPDKFSGLAAFTVKLPLVSTDCVQFSVPMLYSQILTDRKILISLASTELNAYAVKHLTRFGATCLFADSLDQLEELLTSGEVFDTILVAQELLLDSDLASKLVMFRTRGENGPPQASPAPRVPLIQLLPLWGSYFLPNGDYLSLRRPLLVNRLLTAVSNALSLTARASSDSLTSVSDLISISSASASNLTTPSTVSGLSSSKSLSTLSSRRMSGAPPSWISSDYSVGGGTLLGAWGSLDESAMRKRVSGVSSPNRLPIVD